MRICFQKIKNGKFQGEFEWEDWGEENRTKKIYRALEEACYHFDLAKPIWLDQNIREFQRHAKTRFGADSFVEEIPFDSLEIRVLEEDVC